ncbi:MAG: ADP-ribosylglycohydrolase [uncultured Sulfurovum sp.]|uniref:ADP-ribosylglycohydrolase n=1 Tax=uncultured Sulfurovum sp. TaxID=269237 RepID=A0A6S6SFP9_9BACT|nr:MAG: ADP-ribosylglycohydrolase [uncultured Sulfurovum sp.]
MNIDKRKGLIWGALLADAYSLRAECMDKQETLNTLLPKKHLQTHLNKHAENFTLYGEQSIWLLKHLNEAKMYDPFDYAKLWQKQMHTYEGNKDEASSISLQNLESGKSFMACGSESQNLSVVGRHAPLLFKLDNIDELLESIKLHNCLTHFTKETLDASKYISEVALAMLYDLDVEATLKERAEFYGDLVKEEVSTAFSLKNNPKHEVLKHLADSPNVKGGLALTVYLLLNYHHDFPKLLKMNLLAGGDSSARGMIAGMLVGARYGFDTIKPSWIEELNNYEVLNALIQ